MAAWDRVRSALSRFGRTVDQEGGASSALIGSGLGSLSLRGAGVLFTFAGTALFARLLGPESFGVFSFFLVIAGYVVAPIQIGTNTVVIREVARESLPGAVCGVGAITSAAGRVLFASLCISVALGAVAAEVLSSEWVGLSLAFLLAASATTFAAISHLYSGVVTGLGHVVVGQVPEHLVRPGVLVLLALGLTLVAPESSSAELALGAAAVAGLVAAFMAGALARGYSARRRTVEAARDKQRPVLSGSILTVAVVAGLHTIMAQTDILMLGFLAEVSDVGIYRVGAQFAALSGLVIMAVNSVIAPGLARLGRQGDRSQLEILARQGSRLGFWGTIVVVLVLATASRPVLQVAFGYDFVSAWGPMMILLGGYLFTVVLGSTVTLGNMLGLEKELVRITAIMIAPNVVLNVLLIPRFGTIGAAMATTVSMIIWRSVLFIWVRRRLRINTSIFGRQVSVARVDGPVLSGIDDDKGQN